MQDYLVSQQQTLLALVVVEQHIVDGNIVIINQRKTNKFINKTNLSSTQNGELREQHVYQT